MLWTYHAQNTETSMWWYFRACSLSGWWCLQSLTRTQRGSPNCCVSRLSICFGSQNHCSPIGELICCHICFRYGLPFGHPENEYNGLSPQVWRNGWAVQPHTQVHAGQESRRVWSPMGQGFVCNLAGVSWYASWNNRCMRNHYFCCLTGTVGRQPKLHSFLLKMVPQSLLETIVKKMLNHSFARKSALEYIRTHRPGTRSTMIWRLTSTSIRLESGYWFTFQVRRLEKKETVMP